MSTSIGPNSRYQRSPLWRSHFVPQTGRRCSEASPGSIDDPSTDISIRGEHERSKGRLSIALREPSPGRINCGDMRESPIAK
jgi:hypothetical protein